MLIKAGVDISRINRKIRKALPKIQNVLERYDEELIITSTYEGTHRDGSLHYGNDAIDIREPEKKKELFLSQLKAILGSDFDVILESDHIHIEYDPK